MQHNLVETIIVVICGVIAGCDVWEDIADYARVKEEWYREALGLELKNGIPSHDTMQRIFQQMNPREFEAGFIKWVEESCGEKGRQTISIDGKTVRGSKGKGQSAIHMVSAWANEERLVLGQMATEEKSNEITAVPMLLELLDIKGHIITADAMSCQKEIVKKIQEKEADYVIGLKENQPTVLKAAKEYYEAAEKEPQFYPEIQKQTTEESGHGRIEKRHYSLATDPDLMKIYPEWQGIKGIGRMVSEVTNGEGEKSTESHYYITSLTDIKTFSKAAREHWGVEASLHWCLDMTFREDYSRTRKDHSAENFAVVRHIVLNVLKNMDDKMSVARRRRHCAYDDDYLQKVILSIHA